MAVVTVGTRVKFREEKRPYTVRCCSDNFMICTKPFNLKRSVLYTVVDLMKKIRGTENVVFCMGAETDDQCANMLRRFESGESSVSHRNFVVLDIEKIISMAE